ncbi:MAG TPA: YncE family protein [Dokdonella sp.]|nr:YncE family protein [Dokdonella sp.]
MNIPRSGARIARARLLLALCALDVATAFAAGPYAYLPSSSEATVSKVDLADTAALPTAITVTGTENTTGFHGAALSSNGERLYVSDQVNETVFEIDTTTGSTLHAYFVGSNPRGIAVEPRGRHVYVADFASAEVSIIDTSTQIVTGIDFGTLSGAANASPSGIALNLSGTRAYVTDASVGHRLCRIDLVAPPASVADADCVAVGDPDNDAANPNAVAVSPDGSRAYVVNHNEATVSAVDTATLTVVRTFPLGFGSPNGIAISASGRRAYVGTGLGRIIVLDLARVPDFALDPVIDVIDDAEILTANGVSISPDGTRLLVADTGSNQLHLVNIVGDADVRVASVAVNPGPIAMGRFVQPDAIFVGGFEKAG